MLASSRDWHDETVVCDAEPSGLWEYRFVVFGDDNQPLAAINERLEGQGKLPVHLFLDSVTVHRVVTDWLMNP